MKRIFGLLLVLWILGICGCAKEKSDVTEDLAQYLLLCPSGLGACYETCAATYDANGNGRVDPSEEPNYNTCKGSCDAKCSTLFLLTLTE